MLLTSFVACRKLHFRLMSLVILYLVPLKFYCTPLTSRFHRISLVFVWL